MSQELIADRHHRTRVHRGWPRGPIAPDHTSLGRPLDQGRRGDPARFSQRSSHLYHDWLHCVNGGHVGSA